MNLDSLTPEQYAALSQEAEKYGLQHADADAVVSDILTQIIEGELTYDPSEGTEFEWILNRVRTRVGSKKRKQRRDQEKFLSFTDNPDDCTPGQITSHQLEEIVRPAPLPTGAENDDFMARVMALASAKDGELVLRSARLTQKQLADQENCSQPTIARRLEKATKTAIVAYRGSK